MNTRRTYVGRGSMFNPPNRFEKHRVQAPPPDLAEYFEIPDAGKNIATRFYPDRSHSLLSKNDSPDLGFAYSINPYRGCEHGCVYCYARPSHEYLGFSSGIDFETKIMVKLEAPDILETELRKSSWHPQVVVFSGNTDCYQPAERTLRLTRRCLEVFLRFRNPVSIITKNALVLRDLDILRELASLNLVFVTISITTLDQGLVKRMEPRTSAPHKRLETIERLAQNGIPVCVYAAPVIPGLTDTELPSILEQASYRGARYAGYMILRLSHALKDLFLDWLHREYPRKSAKVIGRIRDIRGGDLSDPEFGTRMTGEGATARAIQQLFKTTCRKLRLNTSPLDLSTKHFSRQPDQYTLAL